VSEQLLNEVGVRTVGQLREHQALLSHLFSPISMDFFLHVALGLGSTRHVEGEEEGRKSVSCERTFAPLECPAAMDAKIADMALRLHRDLSELGLAGKCVTLKLKETTFCVRPPHSHPPACACMHVTVRRCACRRGSGR
jgi:DNA polymerase kappa